MNFHRLANSIVTRLLILGVALVLFGAVVRYISLSNFL